METVLTEPSWVEIKEACHELAEKIGLEHPNIRYIVGITRGGLIPAVNLSHMLDIPMVTVSYSSQTGAGDNKFYNNNLPDVQSTVNESRVVPGSPDILIVDDICDSGETLRDVHDYYRDRGHNVTTVALFYKESSVFKPDHHWVTIPKDSGWITFPWEAV